jgi:hypothetical protein
MLTGRVGVAGVLVSRAPLARITAQTQAIIITPVLRTYILCVTTRREGGRTAAAVDRPSRVPKPIEQTL